MKLQSKLALYNALSKVSIILVFVAIMPALINHVAISNTDQQLKEKKEQVLEIIQAAGISTFIEEGSENGYGSYNLLKEEFISLELLEEDDWQEGIENSLRMVEEEVVNYRVLSHTFEQDRNVYLLEVARSLSTVDEIAATLQKFTLYSLITIILITVFSDVAYTKFLLTPLNTIIEKLRSTKDPSSFRFEKIKTSTTDFKYLDKCIHEMMDRIEAVFLKEREFISNVSHELLTPVSILQSKLENMLVREDVTEENILKLVEAQKTLGRLKNIIKALLLISKIENEQYLKSDLVSVVELVDEVVEEIEDRLQVKGILLVKEIQNDFLIKGCSKTLLHTMVFNLVNNAVKYNREGGKIVIKGFQSSSRYVLEVHDTGIGMEEDNLPYIFNRFKRLEKPDQESCGLGLPIVKTIADFHQIIIKVLSVPNTGSSFHLYFP